MNGIILETGTARPRGQGVNDTSVKTLNSNEPTSGESIPGGSWRPRRPITLAITVASTLMALDDAQHLGFGVICGFEELQAIESVRHEWCALQLVIISRQTRRHSSAGASVAIVASAGSRIALKQHILGLSIRIWPKRYPSPHHRFSKRINQPRIQSEESSATHQRFCFLSMHCRWKWAVRWIRKL